MTLPDGYHALPPGKLASVVTYLEMIERPMPRDRPFAPGTLLRPADRSDLDAYRAVYAAVGSDLLWFSRLVMADEALAAILADPDYEPYVLERDGAAIGILDLDFREAGSCELAFFGLAPEAIGTGLGAALLEAALESAWARPIRRLWVHTCTHDHPSALGFYRRAGFRPYRRMIEIHDDPRLTGHLPREASPQIPLLEG